MALNFKVDTVHRFNLNLTVNLAEAGIRRIKLALKSCYIVYKTDTITKK